MVCLAIGLQALRSTSDWCMPRPRGCDRVRRSEPAGSTATSAKTAVGSGEYDSGEKLRRSALVVASSEGWATALQTPDDDPPAYSRRRLPCLPSPSTTHDGSSWSPQRRGDTFPSSCMGEAARRLLRVPGTCTRPAGAGGEPYRGGRTRARGRRWAPRPAVRVAPVYRLCPPLGGDGDVAPLSRALARRMRRRDAAT